MPEFGSNDVIAIKTLSRWSDTPTHPQRGEDGAGERAPPQRRREEASPILPPGSRQRVRFFVPEPASVVLGSTHPDARGREDVAGTEPSRQGTQGAPLLVGEAAAKLGVW